MHTLVETSSRQGTWRGSMPVRASSSRISKRVASLPVILVMLTSSLSPFPATERYREFIDIPFPRHQYIYIFLPKNLTLLLLFKICVFFPCICFLFQEINYPCTLFYFFICFEFFASLPCWALIWTSKISWHMLKLRSWYELKKLFVNLKWNL